MSEKKKGTYVAFTPGETLVYESAAKTEQGAWDKLMKAAAHMPYKTKENFIKRGYTVEFVEGWYP